MIVINLFFIMGKVVSFLCVIVLVLNGLIIMFSFEVLNDFMSVLGFLVMIERVVFLVVLMNLLRMLGRRICLMIGLIFKFRMLVFKFVINFIWCLILCNLWLRGLVFVRI